MLSAVVALPSATLSATSLRPGYFAASSSLNPLARWSSEPTPGSEVISATSPSTLPYFSLIASARPSAPMRPPWTLSVVRNEVKALESAAEFDADDRHLLRRFVDRLAERLELGRGDDDRGRLFGDGVLEDRNLAVDVRLGLGAELRNLDAEVLASLARAGQHDLPIVRCGVLDDDRDRRLVSGVSRRAERGGHGDGRGDKHCLHEASSFDESTSALVSICISGRPEGASFG